MPCSFSAHVRHPALFLAGALLAALLASCGNATNSPVGANSQSRAASATPGANTADSGEKLKVVATTTLVGDTVRSVAGELVDLTVLLAPGTEAHSYEPSPQDIAAVAGADVVFMNGIGLEGFMAPLLQNAGGSAKVVEVSEGIELIMRADEHTAGDEHAEEEHERTADPHVWFSPANVEVWASAIARVLSELDAPNAPVYASNASTYRTKLQELDTWIKEQVARVPEARRVLVTDHDTFGYLADRYGFQLIGAILPNVSSSAEPTPQELVEIQNAVREHNVPAIFVASEASSALARRVAEDTGAKLVFVYVESLSAPGGPVDTYESFMRYNISAIVDALT